MGSNRRIIVTGINGSLGALTGIRFFAAFAVLAFHYGAAFTERMHAPHAVSNLLHNGYMAVSLFFVLSGYILAYSYAGRLEEFSGWVRFIISRMARIYPVYLLSLFLALPVLTSDLNVERVVRVLFMIQSWGSPASDDAYAWVMQAWTLSVEFFFYLTFPAVFLLMQRIPRLGRYFCVLAAAAAIAYWGTSSVAPGVTEIPNMSKNWIPPLPVLRWLEFLFGILLCLGASDSRGLVVKISRPIFVVVVIVSIFILLATASTRHEASYATLLFGVLIVQLASGMNAITTFLSSKVLILLGGASYALYILQGPIREWLRFLLKNPLDAALNPFVAIGVSVVVFLYFEEPMRCRIQSWGKRLMGQASTAG